MTRSLRGKELVLASGNAGKLAEFADLLAPYGTRVRSLSELGLAEPDETEFTFAGNARLKAKAAALASGLPALADDSGLTVDGLGGSPGIYTADWAETGAGRNFEGAMRKTWHMLSATGMTHHNTAAFHCILALVWPDGQEVVVEGRLNGAIVWPMRGLFGHGYDPIFQPNGHQRTMGELSTSEKNAISHRADAVRKFAAICFT